MKQTRINFFGFFFGVSLLIISGFVFLASAQDCIQGKGPAEKEIRQVETFDAITVDGAFKVKITSGSRQHLEIHTEKNILLHIVTTVKDHELLIHPARSTCSQKGVTLNISLENLKKISVSGANDVIVSGVDNQAFVIDMSGAGNTFISGQCKRFIAVLSGAGRLKAGKLRGRDVQITISGAGSAVVNASHQLDADVSGAGSICYTGHPEEVNKNVAGAGVVRPCTD